MGNTIQMGNFDECVNVEDVPSDFGVFSGQHCLVSMSQVGKSVTQRSAVQMVNEYSVDVFKEERKGADHLEKSVSATYFLMTRKLVLVPKLEVHENWSDIGPS